jgi:hypothetical protein
MYLLNFSFSFSFGKSALIDCLINPLQEQMEEWKKVANQLDKDHAKGMGKRSGTSWHSEELGMSPVPAFPVGISLSGNQESKVIPL